MGSYQLQGSTDSSPPRFFQIGFHGFSGGLGVSSDPRASAFGPRDVRVARSGLTDVRVNRSPAVRIKVSRRPRVNCGSGLFRRPRVFRDVDHGPPTPRSRSEPDIDRPRISWILRFLPEPMDFQCRQLRDGLKLQARLSLDERNLSDCYSRALPIPGG